MVSGARNTASIFFGRRKFGQQMWPVASHNPAYLVIDGANVVHALKLAADHLKLFRAQRATVQKFHRHDAFAPPRGGGTSAANSCAGGYDKLSQ